MKSDKTTKEPTNISRRNFLTTLGVIAGGVVSNNTLQACAPASTNQESTPDGGTGDTKASTSQTLKLSDDAYSPLATVGGMAAFDSGDTKILLIRTAEDKIVALDRICTHTFCDMKPQGDGGFGKFEDGKLVCTCHNSIFGADGKKISGPASSDLKSYKAEFDKDKNEVTITL